MKLSTRRLEFAALAAAIALATVVFTAWPQIDIAASRLFFRDGRFAGNTWSWAQAIYRFVPWYGAALAIGAAWVVIRRIAGRGASWSMRRAILLLLAGLFGVGIAVHVVLKDNWGRPRPASVEAFGGPLVYQQALQPSTQCARNCSFVSGHAAAGFVLLTLGVFGSRRTRFRWLAAGFAAGLGIGAARVAQGAHFFSDIVFCGLVMWLVAIALRECWLRAAVLRRRHRASVRSRAAQSEEGSSVRVT
jgi:membrane-associated PAP2 superfamily phosphatase